MGDFRHEEAIWSIGLAALISLYDKDPEEDFDAASEFVRFNGRMGIEYDGQEMPMTFGGLGQFLVPGIVVESGSAVDYRGKRSCPIILSIAREVQLPVEAEIVKLGVLCQKLYNLVFVRKQCPVYRFAADDTDVIEIVGRAYWKDETLRYPLPSERLVMNPDLGGWIRNEYRFTIAYTLDGGGFVTS